MKCSSSDRQNSDDRRNSVENSNNKVRKRDEAMDSNVILKGFSGDKKAVIRGARIENDKQNMLLSKALSNTQVSRRYMSSDYLRNNTSFVVFLNMIILINILIMALRANYFRDFPMLNGGPNLFYMISRATGRAILFNTCLVVILVLRYSITMLRKFGFGNYLPLDHNVYFHKLVGCLIFAQGMIHGIMHLLNFKINIQPNPIKFIHLSWNYWTEYNAYPIFMYTLPDGCKLVRSVDEEAVNCAPGSLDIPRNVHEDVFRNITFCQVCPFGEPYTYTEWIFTKKHGMFGMGGCANITGVALLAILLIMFVCSLPFVRKSGHFQVFYSTHMLYFAYFILLVFHAPDFWKWFLVPGLVWIIELVYRSFGQLFGHGKTIIKSGVILPSKVISLVVEKPPGFNFSAGDMVYVKIPKIAAAEWHPFTISSAPEVQDEFTLHIRAVGGWTNSLYSFFSKEHSKLIDSGRLSPREGLRRRQSVRTHDKIKDLRTVNYSVIMDEDQDMEKPVDIFIDGPFGCPASNVYRAQHAVLIGTGIGVTPFASILQSIMHRYWEIKQSCPNCNYKWSSNWGQSMFRLQKVDFFWINRDIRSFEWFLYLICQLDIEQVQGGQMKRFLDIHLYNTSAKKDGEASELSIYQEITALYDSEVGSAIDLGSRVNPGRPDWDQVFMNIRKMKRGQVTVFYCGNPTLAAELEIKCERFKFSFRKEKF